MLQLNYEAAAQLWNSTAVRWTWDEVALEWGPSVARQCCCVPVLSSLPALPAVFCSSLLHSVLIQLDFFTVLSLARKIHSILGWKENVCSLSQRRADLEREIPITDSWLVCPHANGDSKFLQLFQKALTWWVRKESFWLVNEDANRDIAAQLHLHRESPSPVFWNAIPGTPM